jgi:hypothetical protein
MCTVTYWLLPVRGAGFRRSGRGSKVGGPRNVGKGREEVREERRGEVALPLLIQIFLLHLRRFVDKSVSVLGAQVSK